MLMETRDRERRLLTLRDSRGLRSRGGGASSPSLCSTLRFEAAFETLFETLFLAFFPPFSCASSSSPEPMRSCGESRRPASDAAGPNRGSLRPPLFFRPHAIHQAVCTTPRSTLAGGV